MDYNPNAPDLLGLELMPRSGTGQQGSDTISSPADAFVFTMGSTVTENVEQLAMQLKSLAPGRAATVALIELLEAGHEIPVNVASDTYFPNGSTATACKNQAGSTVAADLWQSVDDPTVNLADYVESTAANAALNLEFATAPASGSWRIQAVRVRVVAARVSSYFSASISLNIANAGLATGPTQLSTTPTEYVFDLGEIHPSTGQPWTVAQLQALDTGTPRLQLLIGNNLTAVRIYRVVIEVDHCSENRLTRNVVGVPVVSELNPSTRVAWIPTKPDGTANWAKSNGTPFTVVVRQPRYGAQPGPEWRTASVVYIPLLGPAPFSGYTVYLDPTLSAPGGVVALGVGQTDVISRFEMVSGGLQSVDSQTYSFSSSGPLPWVQIRQYMTPGVTHAYTGILLPINYTTDANGIVNPLVINLRLVSDDSLIATTTITRAEADAVTPDTSYAKWRVMQAGWDGGPVALTGGVQVYVELVYSGPYPSTWTPPLLVDSPPAFPGGLTWHGTTDYAVRDSTLLTADYPWVLISPLDPLTGLVATGSTFEFPPAIRDCLTCLDPVDPSCVINGIAYVDLQWDQAVMGEDFGFYEVQRSDEKTTWQTIARIPDEALSAYYDPEPRLGVTSCYRVRVVNRFGISSDWSDSSCAETPATGVGYTFTSGWLPTNGVAYTDIYDSDPQRDYTFPEADERITQRLSGRDYFVAFQGCERRGSTFRRSLLVNAFCTPITVGIDAFDQLRDLVMAGAPYICVRDENGDRWYASVTVPDASIAGIEDRYFVTVDVVEVQGEASVSTVGQIPDAPPPFSHVGTTADLRWAVHAPVGVEADLRWEVLEGDAVGITADLRWAVEEPESETLITVVDSASEGASSVLSQTITPGTDIDQPGEGDLCVAFVTSGDVIADLTATAGWEVAVALDDLTDGVTASIWWKRGEPPEAAWTWTQENLGPLVIKAQIVNDLAGGLWTVDKTASNNPAGIGTSAATGSTGPLSGPDEFAYGGVAHAAGSNGGGVTATDGFAWASPQSITRISDVFKITTDAAAVNPTISWLISRPRVAVIATFLPGLPGPGPVGVEADLRWAVLAEANPVGTTADLRWAVEAESSGVEATYADAPVGAGRLATGGTTPVVVSNTNSSGSGSFLAAISSSGRFITFTPGLTGEIQCNAANIPSNTTIDGRGADITFGPSNSASDHAVGILAASNVIVRNVRFKRLFANDQACDLLQIYNASNRIWIDHCEFWGPSNDGGIDITGDSTNVTVSWCYVHDFVGNTHPTGDPHNTAALWGRNVQTPPGSVVAQITSHHNYWLRVRDRQPLQRHCQMYHFNDVHEEWGAAAAGLTKSCVTQQCGSRALYERVWWIRSTVSPDGQCVGAGSTDAECGAGLRPALRYIDCDFDGAPTHAEQDTVKVTPITTDCVPDALTDPNREIVRAYAGWNDVPLP